MVVTQHSVVRLAGHAVVAIAVFQHQIAPPIVLNQLSTGFGNQVGDLPVLVTLGDEHTLQHTAIATQGFGVGHPAAGAQLLEAPRRQRFELTEVLLRSQQFPGGIGAARRQRQRQPAHHQRHQRGRAQGVRQQALLAHAGGRQRGHFAFQIQPAVAEHDGQEQAQRQDQLQEARHAVEHHPHQHAGVEHAPRRLRQVLDEAPAHDDHQQHGADRGGGYQQLAEQVAEDDHNGHSRVVSRGRQRSH